MATFSQLPVFAPHASDDLVQRIRECAVHGTNLLREKAYMQATLNEDDFDDYMDEYDQRADYNWREILWLMELYLNEQDFSEDDVIMNGQSLVPVDLSIQSLNTSTEKLQELLDYWARLQYELSAYSAAVVEGRISKETLEDYKREHSIRLAHVHSDGYKEIVAKVDEEEHGGG